MSVGRRRSDYEAARYRANSMGRANAARWICEAPIHHPSCPADALFGGPKEERYEIHHVWQRRHDGPDDSWNLRFVSSACHRRIHARPDEAFERRLLLPKSPPPCPRCGGSRSDPDSEGDRYYGVVEPGSLDPCRSCDGWGVDLPAWLYDIPTAAALIVPDTNPGPDPF